ncbi:divergent polysaccharide deacetylase family protein [bacterium]|nr:MAG: divergent polysaccharide deacetylase family protein [bacterium]
MVKAGRQENYIRIFYILVSIIIVESALLMASCQREPGVKEKVIAREKKPVEAKVEKPARPGTYQGRIAIVLDDWGYSLNNAETLKEIKEPLTLAILPRRAYSGAISQLALELKKEAILHLPLEPRRQPQYRLEPDTIVSSMPRKEVVRILEADIKSVPGIKGVSNHMGSLATENDKLMTIIFAELKKRGLYFLDSFTGKTVCKKLSGSMGIPYARRHVFLDNKLDRKYIVGQIETLAKISAQEGAAIGIGHDREKTMEVLAECMPDLRKRGFKFVYVSELVK